MTLPNAAGADENAPFYFLHIPKTAGSSLNLLFKSVFPEERILPRLDWHHLLSLDSDGINQYWLYSGHFYSYFHKLIPTPLRYLTFLRDPVERALSHYGHVIRDNTHYLHQKALELGSFSAYIRDESVQFTISNFQVKALSLDADPFSIAANLSQEQISAYELEKILESAESQLTTNELLEIAMQNLKQFCFVGITERYEESLQLLCHTFGWPLASEIKSTNINHERITIESLSHADINLLHELNDADIALYAFAKNDFDIKLKNMKSAQKFISYAQNFEDVMLWRALKHVSDGFYIDVGAWSPDLDSVTKAFYNAGWRGINVEPNPAHIQSYQQKRPKDINLCCALSDKAGEMEMYFVSSSGLSTLSQDYANQHLTSGFAFETNKVVVETLNAIWDKYIINKSVHFLKVDVEGFEENVLKGNDWKTHRPWILVIEATEPGTQIESYQSWEPYLLSNDYVLAYLDGLNRFYVAEEHRDLLDHFKYPPNVFDNYLPVAIVDANSKATEAYTKTLRVEVLLLEAEAKCQEAEAKCQEAEAKCQEAEAKCQEAEAKCQEADRELELIKSSTLWKLSKSFWRVKSILIKLKTNT
jgi:FkbM family methyltransferase